MCVCVVPFHLELIMLLPLLSFSRCLWLATLQAMRSPRAVKRRPRNMAPPTAARAVTKSPREVFETGKSGDDITRKTR